MNHLNSETLALTESRLAALCWGGQDAPVWVALHGWMDNAASFTRIAPVITHELGIRIIALDFSGHGHSAHRALRSEYSMWSYCHDVLDAMDELGLNQATLVGHSLGAGVANILAAIEPHRIKGVVLIDGLLGRLSTPANLVDQLRRGLSAQRRESSGHSLYPDIDHAVDVRVRKSMLPIDANTARPIVVRNLKGNDQVGYRLRLDRQVMAAKPMSFTEEQAVAIMQGIQCPALLVQGREGIIPLRDPNHACRQAIRGLTHVNLAGGHHLHLDPVSYEPVARSVIKWARRQPALLSR